MKIERMTLREAILDALADDGESIVQILGYLKHLGYIENSKTLKYILENLLEESIIMIVYPPNKTITDFKVLKGMNVEDFWFEMTPKGYREWQKIGNKDKLHKDHWDVTDSKGNKIREVDFDGIELWPNGPKNKKP